MSGFRRSQLPQNIDLGPDMLFKDLHVGHCHTPSCAAMSAFGDRLREGLRLRDGLGEDGRTPELFDVAVSRTPELFDVVGGTPELFDVVSATPELFVVGGRTPERIDVVGGTPELFDVVSTTPELFDVVGGAPVDVEHINGALQLSTAVGCCVVEDDEDAGTSGRRYRGDLKRGRRHKGDLEDDRKRKAA